MSYHDTMSGKMTSHNSSKGVRPSKKKRKTSSKPTSGSSSRQRIPTPAMKRTKGRY